MHITQISEQSLKDPKLPKNYLGKGMSGTFALVDRADKTGAKYEDAIETAIIAMNEPKECSVTKIRDYLGRFPCLVHTSFIFKISRLKGTVNVISCDPHCKNGNARFTTVPLKALFDQV